MSQITTKNKLGQTGLEVSPLGLGTVKIGRNQGVKNASGDGFKLPSDKQVTELLATATECGINLLDTAPAYGIAEERLGKILRENNWRDNFIISTKVGEEFHNDESHYDFSAKYTRESVHRSLKRLQTDRLECVLVHCHSDDLDIINNSAVLETLSELKSQGDILSFGVSTMSIEGGLKAVELSDTVMVSYNIDYTAEQEVIAAANRLGKGVLIKKGLLSGHISQHSMSDCMEAVFSQEGVSSLTFGTTNPEHLRSNVESYLEIGKN